MTGRAGIHDDANYLMTPDLFVEIGTDRFHTAKLGPVTASDVMAMLRYETPDAAYRAALHDSDDLCASGVNSETLKEMLMEAHAEYQSVHDDEEYEPFGSMKWLGISFRAKCDEVDVWVQRLVGEKGHCQVYVDRDAVDSEARACGLAALEALAPLRKPGGKRGRKQ